MFISVFSDELQLDFPQALEAIRAWGVTAVDLRGNVLGKAIHNLSAEELAEVKALLAKRGMRVGAIESSLAKVHLPDVERQQAEAEKLEGLIRAADALDCRLVRAFFFWQPKDEERGRLHELPERMDEVLAMFEPLARRAREANLTLAFENCGVSEAEALAVLERLHEPGWGLAWDVSNGWASETRPKDEVGFMVDCARQTRIVHVKAKSALEDLDGAVVPWDRVLACLKTIGFDGPVSTETHAPKGTPAEHTEFSRRTTEVIQKAWPQEAADNPFRAAMIAPTVMRDYDPVGWAVVGLGLGRSRGRMIHQTPGCRLVGVCDTNAERAEAVGGELGVAYSTELTTWLENDAVEAIFIATPTGLHKEIALAALDAGKHVLTTKPMEASLAACDVMISKAEEKGLLLGVDFGRRFETSTQTLRHAVQSKVFGRLLSCEAALKIRRTDEYFAASGGWRGTRKLDGGGVLSNQAIHLIDTLAFCLGIPEAVRCQVWTQTHDIEAEDLGTAVWRYANGLVLNLFATSSYPHSTWYRRIELCGAQGAYAETAGGPPTAAIQWYVDGAWSTDAPKTVASKWLNGMDNFAAAIRTGADMTCSGRDGRRSQAVLEAMYLSADKDGDWVAVEPEFDPAAVQPMLATV